MRGKRPAILAAGAVTLFLTLAAVCGAACAGDAPVAATTPGITQPAKPQAPAAETVLNTHEVESILGREVRSSADENMGRVVDVLVDQQRPSTRGGD